MVSKQETARPLLTPGEVMQLPPADELVLVSGLAPIRAKKVRHYEDGNFTTRISAVPELGDGAFRDCPKPRPNDWGVQVRGEHGELASFIDGELSAPVDEGGLGQQRHPSLPESELDRKTPPDRVTALGLDDSEDDVLGQSQTIERLRAAADITRAHAMNEGDHHRGGDNDLLPAF
jgi:type IV secretion system protein VirD4